MFQELATFITACVLIILVAASSPQAQAKPLAQATSMSMQMDNTPTPMSMPMDSTPMAMPMSDGRLDANGATVTIVSPANDATINDNSVIVRVETTNLTLGKDGAHFHLYVDGKVQGMSEGASSSIMAHDLTPGEHTFEVVLANGMHQELNASHMIKVNVQLAGAPAASTSGDSSALVIVGLVAAVVVMGGVGFAVSRRK
jgi:hypothetical protein